MRYVLILIAVMFSWMLPAKAELFVTTKHSAIQKMFPRGELFPSCTSTGNLSRLIEGESNVPGCQLRRMTAATRRNDYISYDNSRYIIVRFLQGGWDYYTYNQSNRRWKKH